MKTASFFSYTGPGRISIARFPPRGTPAGFRVYKLLAPGPWFNQVTEEEYRKLYFAGLEHLDPQKVWNDLHALHPGVEPVLLCWETPQDLNAGTTFCHRRMVAAWFRQRLHQGVEEMPPA